MQTRWPARQAAARARVSLASSVYEPQAGSLQAVQQRIAQTTRDVELFAFGSADSTCICSFSFAPASLCSVCDGSAFREQVLYLA
jgi:hypothetical protein